MSSTPRIELMLPPDATGAAHPAFAITNLLSPLFAYNDRYWERIDSCGIINPVAASAIANYWDDAWQNELRKYQKTPGATDRCYAAYAKVSIAHDQKYLWKRAARGEVIENAVIVPLKWE